VDQGVGLVLAAIVDFLIVAAVAVTVAVALEIMENKVVVALLVLEARPVHLPTPPFAKDRRLPLIEAVESINERTLKNRLPLYGS